jgi:hypothetical protein
MRNDARLNGPGIVPRMNAFLRTTAPALILASALTAPASALNNPVLVAMRGTSDTTTTASATIFEHGSDVLVNVTAEHGIPKNVAITLNDGSCANPGGVAFALAPFNDDQSMTTLSHTLADIAGKAKSMVVHQTASETSPVIACGELKG